jgi:hypothetical protein
MNEAFNRVSIVADQEAGSKVSKRDSKYHVGGKIGVKNIALGTR